MDIKGTVVLFLLSGIMNLQMYKEKAQEFMANKYGLTLGDIPDIIIILVIIGIFGTFGLVALIKMNESATITGDAQTALGNMITGLKDFSGWYGLIITIIVIVIIVGLLMLLRNRKGGV